MSELNALKEKVEKSNNLLNAFLAKFKKQLKFAEVTTTDGKVLSYDGELAQGTAVMIDGGAAPDGAYTLEDGTVCNVKDGTIESITKPMMDNETEYQEKFSAVEERIKTIEAKFEDSTKQLTDMAAKFEEFGKLIESLSGNMTKTVEVVEKFAAISAEPAEPPANRKMEKLEKNVATGRRINDILAEINKEKATQ